MANYFIKKLSNGEYKETEKELTLNVNKFMGDSNTLYFHVKGQKLPFVMDYNIFFNILNEQIQQGLLETLAFDEGVLTITIRDGNILKKYKYDFNWSQLENGSYKSHYSNLKKAIYKIITLYQENPNSSISSEMKYIRLIYDILNGDRVPIIDNKEDILRVFEVYNAHKEEFLDDLLQNVIFYDNNNNIIDYQDKLRERKINKIRYDVYNQMETAILIFSVKNQAYELYQDYLKKLYIPKKHIHYQYVDDDGNVVDATAEIEEGTIFSLGKEYLNQKIEIVKNKANEVLKRIKK